MLQLVLINSDGVLTSCFSIIFQSFILNSNFSLTPLTLAVQLVFLLFFYNLPNKSYPPSLLLNTLDKQCHPPSNFLLLTPFQASSLLFISTSLGPRIFPVLHSNNNIINKIFQQLNFENSTSNLHLTFYPFLLHLSSHFPSLPLILSYFNIPPSNPPPLSLPIPPSNLILL